MPTYEYKCDACGHAFEKFQTMSSAPIKKCPVCGKSKVRRLIGTGAALIFKGSGFYITDYRDKAYQDKAKADTGSSEAKPAETASPSGDTPKPADASKSTDASKASADKPVATPAPAPAPTSKVEQKASKSAKKK